MKMLRQCALWLIVGASVAVGSWSERTSAGESAEPTAANPIRPDTVDGEAEDEYQTGWNYERGLSGPKDHVRAGEWYQRAAARGHAEAQFRLAFLYHNGDGVPQDFIKAKEWAEKSAALGNSNGQAALATLYRNGQGTPRDLAKAKDWYQKSAAQGNAYAETSLGYMYASGEGIPRDPLIAVQWYQKAADQGNSGGQLALGAAYKSGDGVPQNTVKAVEWFRKSADGGDDRAQYELARIYFDGNGLPANYALASEWFQKAAAQGNARAQLALADCYYSGRGLARDIVLAYAWTNLAAAGTDKDAAKTAGALRTRSERELAPAEIAEGQSLSSTWKPGVVMARGNSPHEPENAGSSNGTHAKKYGTGTLFVVTGEGLGVTNQHVTHECKELHLEGRGGVATVVTEDATNDLALVKIPGQVSAVAPLAKEPEKLRQGDAVVVFGFPLNAVLSSGGNLTPGIVSALTGLENNTSQIQITAPIQPGSSGSPVMNKSGDVVGVVSSKLSDSVMATATGSVGQNVNFAVSGQTLKAFLDAHQVAYTSQGEGWFARDKDVADIGAEARKWTAVIECWK